MENVTDLSCQKQDSFTLITMKRCSLYWYEANETTVVLRAIGVAISKQATTTLTLAHLTDSLEQTSVFVISWEAQLAKALRECVRWHVPGVVLSKLHNSDRIWQVRVQETPVELVTKLETDKLRRKLHILQTPIEGCTEEKTCHSAWELYVLETPVVSVAEDDSQNSFWKSEVPEVLIEHRPEDQHLSTLGQAVR